MAIRGECNSFASPWRFFRILYFWFTLQLGSADWSLGQKKDPKGFYGIEGSLNQGFRFWWSYLIRVWARKMLLFRRPCLLVVWLIVSWYMFTERVQKLQGEWTAVFGFDWFIWPGILCVSLQRKILCWSNAILSRYFLLIVPTVRALCIENRHESCKEISREDTAISFWQNQRRDREQRLCLLACWEMHSEPL